MAVAATGFFDGVHLGHRLVIGTLVDAARKRGEESVVLTFWPHPRTVLGDASDLRLLNTIEEKIALLKSLGVDRVQVIPFTSEFSLMSTRDYLEKVVRDGQGASAVLLGYDNRIGNNPGSPDEIAGIARECGLEVIRADSVCASGTPVSSTRIRRALSEGDVELASELLGYDYPLTSMVVGGKRLGRTIGFPTANMVMGNSIKLIPAAGVYLSRVEVLGRSYFGMTNVSDVIETHIFDFEGDIYGERITVSFLWKMRGEMKFSGVEELRAQLSRDEISCKNIIFGGWKKNL